jgi:hypothetical protein
VTRRGGFKTEAELGTAVSEWISQSGWDVYPEVTGGGGERRADLVAVCGSLLWVVECKMHFGLEVLGQAHRWRDGAHYVSIAVPQMPRDSGFARLAAVTFGIGIIVATPPRWRDERREWSVRPPDFNRRASVKRLRSLLNVGQKAFTAGAQAGFYTPFQGTCRALRELLDQHPEGVPVKDAIAALKEQHHYRSDSTARASMMKWARLGRVPGVRLEETSKPARFVRVTEAKT